MNKATILFLLFFGQLFLIERAMAVMLPVSLYEERPPKIEAGLLERLNPDGQIEMVPVKDGVRLKFKDRDGRSKWRRILIGYKAPLVELLPENERTRTLQTYDELAHHGSEWLLKFLKETIGERSDAVMVFENSPTRVSIDGLFFAEDIFLKTNGLIWGEIDLSTYLYMVVHSNINQIKEGHLNFEIGDDVSIPVNPTKSLAVAMQRRQHHSLKLKKFNRILICQNSIRRSH